jgi:hypothetical protein
MPGAVSLWHQDGSWLEIWSEMVDLADRNEVGILAFEMTDTEPKYDHITVLNNGPRNILSACRLTVEEKSIYVGTGSIDVEVGITLDVELARSITILGGAFPCSLAILGWFDIPRVFDPEYQIYEYKKSPLVSRALRN